MLKVFVCEDDELQKNSIENFIRNTIIAENMDMEIVLSTGNPHDVIGYLKNKLISGLYFLDVDLNSDINGIELAEQIRKYDPRGFIVFVTTHAEMSYLTFKYKVEAMDYIIKDKCFNIKHRIYECVLNANKRYNATITDSERCFTFEVENKIIKMDFDRILFFKTSQVKNKICIHAFDRQIEFCAKMKYIEEKLDNRFYRCHRSYIINKSYAKEIDYNNRIVYMLNGEKCLIYSNLMKEVNISKD